MWAPELGTELLTVQPMATAVLNEFSWLRCTKYNLNIKRVIFLQFIPQELGQTSQLS
jgi:hypothetical protein